MDTVTKGRKGSKSGLDIEKEEIRKARFTLRALDHKLRQKLLQLIDKNTEMRVTEIYGTLKIEQSVASQHLAILRRGGFVNTSRDGKNIYYTVNYGRIKEVEEFSRQVNASNK